MVKAMVTGLPSNHYFTQSYKVRDTYLKVWMDSPIKELTGQENEYIFWHNPKRSNGGFYFRFKVLYNLSML